MNRQDLQNLAEAYAQISEKKKDDSYLETDMKKRQENNEKARKEMAKVKGQKNPHFEQYTVTNADKKGNTTAYQNYKKGVKGKDGKPLYKAADHMKEGVRDVDPEKGTAERKARLEKKRGMKMDDHPQYQKEGYGAPGHNPGSGEKSVARAKALMDKQGRKGAPGLNAMAAAKKEHEARRGVKKEEVEQVAEADTSDENRNSPAHKDRSNEGLSDRQIRMKKFAQKRAQMLVKKEEVEVVDEATYPSDFKNPDGSKRSVAKKKDGRPIQHDQPTSGGRRKTVDEGYKEISFDKHQKMYARYKKLSKAAIQDARDSGEASGTNRMKMGKMSAVIDKSSENLRKKQTKGELTGRGPRKESVVSQILSKTTETVMENLKKK